MTLRHLFLALLLSACATARDSGGGQRSIFDKSSYETVFAAFRAILRDEGYVVEREDPRTGIIVARIEQPSAFGSTREVMVVYGGGDSSSAFYDFPKREGYEVLVNLAPLKTAKIEAHLNIQRVEFYEQGGVRSSSVEDKDSYRTFFDKVRVELERRKLREGRV